LTGYAPSVLGHPAGSILQGYGTTQYDSIACAVLPIRIRHFLAQHRPPSYAVRDTMASWNMVAQRAEKNYGKPWGLALTKLLCDLTLVLQRGTLRLPYAWSGGYDNLNIDNSTDGSNWSKDQSQAGALWGAGAAVDSNNHFWVTFPNWNPLNPEPLQIIIFSTISAGMSERRLRSLTGSVAFQGKAAAGWRTLCSIMSSW